MNEGLADCWGMMSSLWGIMWLRRQRGRQKKSEWSFRRPLTEGGHQDRAASIRDEVPAAFFIFERR